MSRNRGMDICNVKKLNCWGNQINDISVVRRMPNLEVLALSRNSVSTLVDLQFCPNLTELYLRDNSIADLNELVYLQQLPRLRSLWLADNPCAKRPDYRLAVLRALPRLQRFENEEVDAQEQQRAFTQGPQLVHPEHAEQREEVEDRQCSEFVSEESPCSPEACSPGPYDQQSTNHFSPETRSVGHCSPERLSPHVPAPQQQQQVQTQRVSYRRHPDVQSVSRASLGSERTQRLSYSEQSFYSSNTTPPHAASNRSQRFSYSGPYSRVDESTSVYSTPPSYERTPGGVDDDGYRSAEVSHSYHRASLQPSVDAYSDSGSQRHVASRPRKKSSNVLSAVLCLIKELDVHGLEVVETSVRCRIHELED